MRVGLLSAPFSPPLAGERFQIEEDGEVEIDPCAVMISSNLVTILCSA